MLQDQEKKYLFGVVCAVLNGNSVPFLLDGIDYGELFEAASEQGVFNLFCAGLKNIFLPDTIADEYKKNKAKQIEINKEIDRLLGLFEKNGFKCLPIDGWALRGLYPEPYYRESNDCDILVEHKNREKIKFMLKRNGYSCVRECEYSDYYFKPPHTKIILKTEQFVYDGKFPLWSRAVLTAGTHYVYTLSPEDRYVCSLLKLRQRLDKELGGVKILLDVFVLNHAFSHVFNNNYVNASLDSLELGFFEITINDLYKNLFLGEDAIKIDKFIYETLFHARPDRLPPKYISPEKELFIKRVKRGIFFTGVFFTLVSVVVLILIFNNSFTKSDESSSEISKTLSGLPEFSEPQSGDESELEPIAYNDGIYLGYTKDGIPHGTGVMNYYSGDSYEGEFKEGIRDGYGVFVFALGGRYEGEHKNNLIEGTGIMYYSNGDITEGTFVDGIPNGECIFRYENGNVYEGMLVDGIRNGNGIFTMANGDVYTGDFVDGFRHGTGTYIYSDGTKYTGDWVEGAQTGYGVHTFEGGKYEGEFFGGKYSGTGKLWYTNGDIYTGKFLDGQPNDTAGILNSKNGDKYTGGFKNGVFSGSGTINYVNGDIVKGSFTNGKLHGRAEYYIKEFNIWQNILYDNGEIKEYLKAEVG